MKTIVVVFVLLIAASAQDVSAQAQPVQGVSTHKPAATSSPQTAGPTDLILAERFAKLALACVHQEYPNKIAHTMNSDGDVAPPRKLTPAFYGCYDWHSSVHGHWMLARLGRKYPDFAGQAIATLQKSITRENIAVEVAYLNAKGRASFERPYGLAWLLQLGAELREWGAKEASDARVTIRARSGVNGRWMTPGDNPEDLSRILHPLEEAVVVRLKTWLPKLSHPLRTGEHSQTAFALGLMLDYAKVTGDKEFERLLVDKALAFYLHDKACPLNYEPGGEDFLSPCLAEADVMRRVLAQEEYGKWLRGFLPGLFAAVSRKGIEPRPWLEPAVVTDPTDGKLAHLDGLNLSRAWMLEGMAAGLDTSGLRPLEQARVGHVNATAMWKLQGAAKAQRDAGLAAVTGKHYEGGHWLGSFAVYLVTQRGILTTESTESHRGKQDKSK